MADNTSQLKKLVLDLTGLEVKKGAVIRTALKAKIPVKDLDLYNFLRYLVGSDRRFIRFKTESGLVKIKTQRNNRCAVFLHQPSLNASLGFYFFNFC